MFDASASRQPINHAIGWVTDTLLGQTAVTLCVLAVALVGFSMLTGRISLRRGGQVIFGCFVFLGAPVIAASLLALGTGQSGTGAGAAQTVVYEDQPRAELPPVESNR